MSRWFPDLDDYEGIKAALNGGFYGAVGFAVMIALGAGMLLFGGVLPNSGEPVTDSAAALVGILIELLLVGIAAWRFKIEKGLIWGSAILILFVVEILGKIASGTTNVGWVIFYAAIFAGLVNGIRGAWAKRSLLVDEAEAGAG